ncbi:MAG: phytanoyl-CoA dioxygenase family protein [Planctomycetes bacterium]|nr:phytanoyl-CoA dioxygenase family protein [Planctomycetota bacterium]
MTTAVAQPSSRLTPDQLTAWERDGFVAVSGLYTAAEMLRWKDVLRQHMVQDGPDGVPHGVRVWNSSNFPPTMLDAMRDDRVTPILRQIIGPDVEFLSAKAVFKDGKIDFPSPWHQDWFYWEGPSKMSVWIAMDDATVANGCLMFIPGSHKRVFPRKHFPTEGFSVRIEDKELEGLPVATLEVKRGDAVFFSDLAAHSSHPNTIKADRWSFITTYRNAAVLDPCNLSGNLWKEPLQVCGRSVNGAKGRETFGA